MTVADRIMALFTSDDVVLRPSEIMRRAKASEHATRKELTRLIANGRLFRIVHSQYARCATTMPIAQTRDRITRLEARVEQLERLMSDVVP